MASTRLQFAEGGDPLPTFETPGKPERGRTLGNLPLELSSLVGRSREVSEVGHLLADYRLLTLSGPGGSGKTRLALAVARGLRKPSKTGCGSASWPRSRTPLSCRRR